MKGFELLESSSSGERLTARLVISEESPFFEGHFAGEPVLPGVAHLALIQGLVRAQHGARLSILGIEVLRFRAPLGPRDELEASVEPMGADGRLSFKISRNGEIVSGGVVRVG